MKIYSVNHFERSDTSNNGEDYSEMYRHHVYSGIAVVSATIILELITRVGFSSDCGRYIVLLQRSGVCFDYNAPLLKS